MLPIINTPRRYVAVVPIIPENRETYDDAVTYGFAEPLQGYDPLQDAGNSADGAGEGYQKELLTEPEGRERLMNPGLTSDIPDGLEGEINLGPGVSGFEQEAEGSYGKFPSILKDELRGGGPKPTEVVFPGNSSGRIGGLRLRAMPMPVDDDLPYLWDVEVKELQSGADGSEYVFFQVNNEQGERIAYVELRRRPWSAYNKHPDTWEVSNSLNSHPRTPWGAYLYEKAMEWVTDREEYLASDQTVSTEASQVWRKYLDRSRESNKHRDIERAPYRWRSDDLYMDSDSGYRWDPNDSEPMRSKYRLVRK